MGYLVGGRGVCEYACTHWLEVGGGGAAVLVGRRHCQKCRSSPLIPVSEGGPATKRHKY